MAASLCDLNLKREKKKKNGEIDDASLVLIEKKLNFFKEAIRKRTLSL